MTAKTQTQRTTDHRSRRLRVELLLKPDSDEAQALERLTKVHGSQAAAVRHALLLAGGSAVVKVVATGAPLSPVRVKLARAKPGEAVQVTKQELAELTKVPQVQIGPAPVKPGARLKGGKR